MGPLERIWSDIWLGVAALVGALVGVFAQKDLQTNQQRLVFIFTGLAVGYYVTPLVVDWYSIKPEFSGAIGFLLGAFGGVILAVIYQQIRNFDLIGWVKSRISGGGGN